MYELTLIYALAFGALFCLMVLRRPVYCFARLYCPLTVDFMQPLRTVISKITHASVIYSTVVSRGKFLDRWSLGDVLLIIAYVGVNVVCIVLPLSGVEQIVIRSGTLSVVNLIACFAGPYLGFLADVLAVSVNTCRRLHAAAGALGILLAVVHASAAAAGNKALDLHDPKDVFALVVGLICFGK